MIGLTDPSDSIDFVMRQLAVKLQGPRSGNGHGALLGSRRISTSDVVLKKQHKSTWNDDK